MAEINHQFNAGRMNKDLDERLVPNGEYRHALNVEVSTSEGSAVGTVQTLFGNKIVASGVADNKLECIGSITWEKENKVIWLAATRKGENAQADYIFEYDVDLDTVAVVFQEIYGASVLINGALNNSVFMPVAPGQAANVPVGIVQGMTFTALDPATGNTLGPFEVANDAGHGNVSGWLVQLTAPATIPAGCFLTFKTPGGRTLGFETDYLVTGINILEDLLMWTDNNTEPKKINITRSKYGSLPANLVSGCTSLWVAGQNKGRALQEHITVAKKFPLSPPVLTMQTTERGFGNYGGYVTKATIQHLFEHNGQAGTQAGERLQAGDESNGTTIDHLQITGVMPAWEVGDTIELNYWQSAADFSEKVVIRLSITNIATGTLGTFVEFVVLAIDANLIGMDENGDVAMYEACLEAKTPMFENKFPRFAYRWKYEDGEYSAYSPFSEVAFLPGDFDYFPKKGYNLGMSNQIRFLVISKFLPNLSSSPTRITHQTPSDVVEVDILYKESNSAIVYTVDTIKGPEVANAVLGTNNSPADIGWYGKIKYTGTSGAVDKYFPSGNASVYPVEADKSLYDKEPEGSLKIESELIHAAVPANQLLRPYDNVPRKALGQEVSGNRLIYANYLQQYDLKSYFGKNIKPKFQVAVGRRKHRYDYFGGEEPLGYDPDLDTNSDFGILGSSPWQSIASAERVAEKSIKSLRKYQIGVVYMDEYGRQTPVLTDSSGTIQVEKSEAANCNYLNVRLDDGSFVSPNSPSFPSWATHYKYFIKETSNEYYNLSMDRFYDAEDGNVWLSFPSSERNKLSEDSYIILKKQHDNDVAVKEDARYKILAINNEAPTFVKTQQRSMGEVICNFGSDGEPKVGLKHVDIPSSIWTDNYGANFGQGDDPDILAFRVKRDADFSRWYIASGRSTKNNHVRLRSTKTFKFDMSFTQDDSTVVTSPMKGNLKIELARQVVAQLPEFEGRFFAKIHRDITLENNILVAQPEPSYSVIQSQKIQRIKDRSATKSQHSTTWENDPSKSDRRGYHIDESSVMGAHFQSSPQSINSSFGNKYGANGSYAGSSGSYNPYDGVGVNGQPPNSSGRFSNWNATGSGGSYANNPVDSAHWPKLSGLHPTGIGLFDSGMHGLASSSVTADSMMLSYSHLCGTRDPALSSSPSDAEKSFWKLITKTGTRFRWQGDTNVYEIVGSPDGAANVKTCKLENYDNDDGPGTGDYDDCGNHKTRAYIRFKPPMPTIDGTTGELPGGNEQILTNYDPRYNLLAGDGNLWNNCAICKRSKDGEKRILEVVDVEYSLDSDFTSDNPAIWETEPREDVGLDLYYEASSAYPIGDSSHFHGSWNPLGWHNCYSFANGVESNRIRDDFNTPQIDKGPKVSMPLAEQYKEERKQSGLIFSGIFNSSSGVNRLNQFIQAEAITKDLQPSHGSIQKLHSKSTADGDLIAFCEDRVVKILANKDALYNADGNTNVTANNNVLGQAMPYAGAFGISRNPESFANDTFRSYFSDKDRGAILRLSQDGLTPISENGMRDYFHDAMKEGTGKIIGSWDERKGMYHVSIEKEPKDENDSIYIPPASVVPRPYGVAGNGGRGLNYYFGTLPSLTGSSNHSYFAEDLALAPRDIGYYDSSGNITFSPNDIAYIVVSYKDDYGITNQQFLSEAATSSSTHNIFVEIKDSQNPAAGRAVFKLGHGQRVNNGVAQGTGLINMVNNGDDSFGVIADYIYFVLTPMLVAGSLNLHHHIVDVKIWSVLKQDPILPQTVSYSELVQGWVSFKSWMQESGLSINNKFFTIKGGSLYEHYVGDKIATYYAGSSHEIYNTPSVRVLLNDQPGSVKTYSTLNYEGSENRIEAVTFNEDGEYYNIIEQAGWYSHEIVTNLEKGIVNEFIDKEGKYFNYIKGSKTPIDELGGSVENLQPESFHTQGIGRAAAVSGGSTTTSTITVEDLGDID